MEMYEHEFPFIGVLKLKSDRFGMEIVNCQSSNSSLPKLKSDRFGMEILFYTRDFG